MFDSDQRLQAVTDVSPAQWLVDAVSGDDLSVGGLVSPAFERYVRILHPVATSYSGYESRWSEIAALTGRQMHRLVEFESLIGVSRDDKRGADYEAEIGSLDKRLYDQMLTRLSAHTTTPDTTWFCLWDGWGWVEGGEAMGVVSASTGPGAPPPPTVPPAFDPAIMKGPRVSIPGREYVLLRGPIDSWESLFERPEIHEVWQSPSLMWPDDRSWCLVTEIDFDSTYIGGSARLVTELLSDPELEAFPADPEDPADGADEINPQPGR